jgi:hypothetical protein
MDQLTRQRKLKIFVGRTKSCSSELNGRLVLTIVSACSRQSALEKIQSVKISCSKRDFEKWSCEEKTSDYSFIRKEGVWQSETIFPPKVASDYKEINSND